MAYIDGSVAAVPNANKEAYLEHARAAAVIFREQGAIGITETWGDDIPEGKLTDFRRAVQATDGEAVVFSWITWPDKPTRDAAWAAVMADERMSGMPLPFDGKRMIFGGFEVALEA